MGVAGLWEVLRPAGQVRSLTELAVENGFNANPSRQRGFRIGIDASIWFFHAAYGREGENPELRTLFFRCCRLLQTPLLPLFVFDGPKRPAVKRGKRVGGNAHWLTQGMKNIIEAFGFEWCIAPGEAEAELAYLNRIGVIDAVLSDDVDNFLFGATMVIRNPSNTLSGNRAHPVKNAQGKDDGNHVVTYKADTILSNSSVALSRSGTILIGLLSGGDYIPAGLPGCGQKFATGLARAGFGDSLVKAIKELKDSQLDIFLDQWRQDIKNELKTNRSGLLPSKKPSLAASLPDDFPSIPVLTSYADPLTSENTPLKGSRGPPPAVWRNDPDPMRIASLCELYFEWGVKDIIVHRFRTVLWPGIVCRAVRRAVLDDDMRRHPPLVGTRLPGDKDEYNEAPSPSKQLSSTLSALALSSPSKSLVSGSSSANPPTPDSFILSSLAPLTSSTSPDSSRSASPSSSASNPSPLLLEVLSQRAHASTDSTLEYRVLIDPTTLVGRAECGVKGLRPPLVGGLFGIDSEGEDEEGDQSASDIYSDGIERLETAANAASKSGKMKRKARREDPMKPLRLWLPACMIRAAAPALAEAYDEKVRVREGKKVMRGTKGKRRAGTGVNPTSGKTKANNDVDDDDESVPRLPAPKKSAGLKANSKAVRSGGSGGGRRKPKQTPEAQDEAYEFIDLNAGGSPCSSDYEEGTKAKGRAKARQTDVARPTTKASGKADAVNRKATSTSTMEGYFNTTKPSVTRAIKSKSSNSQRSMDKASAVDPIPPRRVYEEDSSDAVLPLPLPKSSRPLDLLRAKSKPGTGHTNPPSQLNSKSTTAPRYEEESSSGSAPDQPSGSKYHPSGLPSRAAQPVPKARNKPLFVDISDTDSDIEVSDIRRPLPGRTMRITTRDEAEPKTGLGNNDVRVGFSVGKTTTFVSEKNRSRSVDGVIDLTVKGNTSRSKNASMPATCHDSVPLSPIGPTPISRSPSKLSHVLLPWSALESGKEESEDELPMFHHGSTKPRATAKRASNAGPVPRPFPMQFAAELPTYLCTSKPREWDGKCREENDDANVVEIVDVFTTPRGPSPPRSPTLSPSPVKSLPAHASMGPSTTVQPRRSNGLPASPAESNSVINVDPHKKTKQRRHGSSESDTPVSEHERNGIFKSPRKSAAHSSPRHVSRAYGRTPSPTPLALSNPGSMRITDNAGRKPSLSDTSAIYISSGSEDEGPCVDHVEAEANEDRDKCTDRDSDTWADAGMILSAPPSPVPLASDDPVLTAADSDAAPLNPTRGSKFKPAPAPVSKADMRSQGSDRIASTSLKGTTSDEDTSVPRPPPCAPLLVARAKRGKRKDNDIIDLTSD